jgi:undecaprenyl-diphosphatase
MKRHKWGMVFIRKQLKVWVAVFAASMILFAALAASVPEQGGSSFEQAAQNLAAQWKSGGATALFKVFSLLGTSIAILAVTLAAAGWIAWRSGWSRGLTIVIGVALAYGANTLIKIWFDRVRPAAAWGIEADGASFPSANAMLGTVLFGLIALSVLHAGQVRRGVQITACILCGALVIMLGLSRLYFHVHYITDILAGYMGGIVVISLMMIIIHAIKSKRGDASL